MSDLTGQNIAHYRLERRLGGGAMASVYQATNQILEETIALKLLLPGADELTRERFRQEARTVSKLAHPNIVRTFQVGQTSADGIAYIAMELVEGQSLSTLLERSQTLTVAETSNLLEPIARALAYAHGLGVIHRDVKPSNILLRRVEAGSPGSMQLAGIDFPVMPLLSDFGIARALDSPELTSAGRTIGTPAYMAPEQCAGTRDIDGRADIYSLGTVLYRCLVGRPPFIGTTTQILHAHVYEPLTIPDEVVYSLPQTVVETLQYSLAKEVDKRYPSAAMMADALLSVSGRTNGSSSVASSAKPQQSTDHGGPSNPTRTMATLPTTETHKASSDGHTTSQQILIPGNAAGAKPRTVHGMGGTPRSLKKVGSTSHPRVTTPLKATPAQRSTNWVGIVLGATLLLLLIFVGIALVRSVLPSGGDELADGQTLVVSEPTNTDIPTPTPNPTETIDASATEEAVASTGDGTPTSIPTFADRATVAPDASTPTPEAEEAVATEAPADEPTNEPTEEPEESTATATVEPTNRPPSVDVLSVWDDAQFFLEQRDWPEALQYLILVRRGDPEFEREEVEASLLDVYVGIATQLNADAAASPDNSDTLLTRSIGNLNKALDLAPDDKPLAALLAATEANISSANGASSTAQATLQQAHAAYAESLASAREFCGAAEQMITAQAVLYDLDLVENQNDYARRCPLIDVEIASVDFIDTVEGRILYSTVIDERNKVMLVPASVDAKSSVLIDNGARASLRPQGDLVAFYSDAPQEAIAAFDLGAGLGSGDRSFQFLYQPESGRTSPPSWNGDGSRFAFSSNVEGDRVTRIYWASNNRSGEYRVIVPGREPNWHPTRDQIVFKGADPTGNNPGIYTANLGARQQSLTNNSSDARPVWSPDGRYVLFMSNGRDEQNWDIYRVEVATGSVVRLTKDPANDGLPSVSPDGGHVAFVSDRGNEWRIWIVPIEGGVPQLLTAISGNLPNWLEHSIQWVK